jgi:hypothetical protein
MPAPGKIGFWFARPSLPPSLARGCSLFPELTRDSLYELVGVPTTGQYEVNNNYIKYTINGTGQGAIGDSSTGLGLMYSPDGSGNFGVDDYIKPGVTWEAYGVQAGSTLIGGANSGGFTSDALVWAVGGSNNYHAVLRGNINTGWVIVQYMTFPNEPIIRIKMTYQNTTGSIQYVKMLRAVDPDIDQIAYDSFVTTNQRGYGSISGNDLVYSIGNSSGKPLSLYIPGNGYTHNTAIISSWPTYNFDSILAGTNNGNGDHAILGAWDIGNVLNGQSVSVCCYYICSNNVEEIVTAIGDSEI